MKSVEEILKDLYDINRIVTTNGCAFMYYRSDLVRQAMEEYASQFREKPKKETSNNIAFKAKLINLGVTADLASDWMAVRKTKRATNTETAFKSIEKEILKSGLSPSECIRIAIENSWSGFKNEWLRNQKTFNNGNQQQSTYEKHEQGFDALFGSGSPFSVPEG